MRALGVNKKCGMLFGSVATDKEPKRMKKTIFILTCIAMMHIVMADGFSQPKTNTLRKVENVSFNPGEKLKYRVHYGFVDAGEAILEVKPELKTFGGRECYHIVGTGRSLGAFDWFFKVRDRYESFIDREAMVPWYFVRRVDEGGYIINENVSFNPYKNTASSESTRNKKPTEKGTYEVPAHIQDMVSAFYYSRTLDITNLKIGDITPIEAFIDNEVVPLNIKFVGREVVKNRMGTFNCVKFKPLLQSGRVFKEKEEMTIWISDDLNKIPIRLETAVVVGSVKMDLVSAENLRNPINYAKK